VSIGNQAKQRISTPTVKGRGAVVRAYSEPFIAPNKVVLLSAHRA